MTKQPTQPLLDINFGTSFTVDAIAAYIEEQRLRGATNGMDRAEFEERLFAFGDLAALPVGHLLDHRVHMPDDIADRLLAGDATDIATMLGNMLCASSHTEARLLVGDALGVKPERDARRLLAVSEDDRRFAHDCLTGHHGDAARFLAAGPTSDLKSCRNILAAMAIYYGALDLQLIAVRQKAIGMYRFAIDDGEMTDTMGALLQDDKALIAGVIKAAAGAASDEPLKGRRPDLITLLKPQAERILADALAADPARTKAGILDEIRGSLPVLKIIAEQAQAEIDTASEGDLPTSGDAPDSGNGSLRRRISTEWAGVSGGVQLGYASQRLRALATHIDGNLARISGGKRVSIQQWFGRRLPPWRSDAVEKLLFVSRSVVWQATGVPAAFGPDGREHGLKSTMQLYHAQDRKAGEDLVKTAKENAAAWSGERTEVGPGVLVASQRWDILPDHRFADRRASSSPPPAADTSRGFVVKLHQPSPQYRAPRKSHRPC